MAPKKNPIFDYDICIACGICAQACPVSALELSKTNVDKYKKAYPELKGSCTGCGICAESCPLDAVEMRAINPDTGELLPPEKKRKKK